MKMNVMDEKDTTLVNRIITNFLKLPEKEQYYFLGRVEATAERSVEDSINNKSA